MGDRFRIVFFIAKALATYFFLLLLKLWLVEDDQDLTEYKLLWQRNELPQIYLIEVVQVALLRHAHLGILELRAESLDKG